MEEKPHDMERSRREMIESITSMMMAALELYITKLSSRLKYEWGNVPQGMRDEIWKDAQSVFEGIKAGLNDALDMRLAAFRREMDRWEDMSRVIKSIPQSFAVDSSSAWSSLLDGLDILAKKEETKEREMLVRGEGKKRSEKGYGRPKKPRH